MRRFWRRGFIVVSKQLFYISIVLTALTLLVFGSAIWLTYAVEKRQNEISQWVSQKIDHPITIHDVRLDWYRLIPRLNISGLQVLSASGQPILSVGNVYVGLSFRQSVLQRQLRVDTVMISDIDVQVHRSADGQVSIAQGLMAYSLNQPTTSGTGLPDSLLSLKTVDIKNVIVQYLDDDNTVLSGRYELKELKLQTNQNNWHVSGSAVPPYHVGREVIADAILTHADNRITQWQVKLATQQLDITAVLAEIDLHGLNVTQGWLDVDAELSGSEKRFAAKGKAELKRALLSKLNDEIDLDAISVEQFKTAFEGHFDQGEWQLALVNTLIQIDGERWPETQATLSGYQQSLQSAETAFIRLGHVSDLNQLLATPNTYLVDYQPAGDIRNLIVKLENDELRILQFDADEVVVLAVNQLPGISGLTGRFDWQNDQLSAHLNAKNLKLYFNEWIEEPITFDVAAGIVNANIQANHWQLSISNAQLVNADLNIRLNGELQHEAGQWRTDSTLDIHYFAAPAWQKYTPLPLLDSDFVEWAQTAFVGGEIQQGQITLQGDPLAYPFDEAPDAGQFSMYLEATGVDLVYFPGWPALSNVNGVVTSSGNDLQIVADEGQIARYQIETARANIVPLVKGQPILNVVGTVHGNAKDGLAFVDNSPLHEYLSALTEAISAEGQTKLDLQLMIPLLNASATEVVGDLHFIDNKVTLNLLPNLVIEQVNGDLRFTTESVSAPNITAQVMGEPAEVIVTADENRQFNITGTTFANVEHVGVLWDGEMVPDISGRTPVNVAVTIAESSSNQYGVHVQVNSELVGVNSSLPEPFDKTAETPRDFQLDYWRDRSPNLQVKVTDLVTFSLDTEPDTPIMNVNLGRGESVLPNTGFTVTGALQTVQLDNWLSWYQTHFQANELATNSVWQPQFIQLNADKVQVAEQTFHSVSTQARFIDQVWQVHLAADEFKGDIHWPMDSDELPTVHFDVLNIQLSEAEIEQTDSRPMKLWPGLNLNIDDLRVNDWPLGHLQAEAIQPNPNRWELVSATLFSDELTASANGQWYQLPGDNEQTQINVSLNSQNVADLLVKLGYQPAMSANRANIDFAIRWPGSPIAFDRATFLGEMSVDIGSGQLKEVDPGAAGRILGLISFTAIPRRLTLDFSDLFGGGLSFSRITGRFDFSEGIAQTRELVLRGDSALVEIQGPINLVEQTYNQTVKVTPSVSSTLPLAGAVAGGPIGLGVGTAIFIADRVAGKIFNREILNLVSYRYQLTGPWSEPEMVISRPPQQ